LCCGLNQG
jgi:hypothetical protein